MNEMLMELYVEKIDLDGVEIQLRHIRETEEDVNNQLRTECFKFLIDWVIPKLRGVEVLKLSGSKKPVISVFKNENDEVFAETHLPEGIMQNYKEELFPEIQSIVKTLIQ